MWWARVQVLTLWIIRAIKLPPNQKNERTTGKKFKGSWPWTHTMHLVTQSINKQKPEATSVSHHLLKRGKIKPFLFTLFLNFVFSLNTGIQHCFKYNYYCHCLLFSGDYHDLKQLQYEILPEQVLSWSKWDAVHLFADCTKATFFRHSNWVIPTQLCVGSTWVGS